MKKFQNSFQECYLSLTKGPSIVWMGLYVIFVSAGIIVFWKNWAYDDPFITYRYASNLAHGLGFVYNPGERVLSTTTPLFTLILAGISPLWEYLPLAANLIGAISVAIGALLLFDIARSQKSPIVGWAALLLYPTCYIVLKTLSSETPLYLAFALAAFAFYFRQNYPLVAVFSALVLLTRPDGALVPGILALDFLLNRRQPIPWRAVGIFLILIIPWIGFSWLYFGSPIPSTLFTKQQQGILPVSSHFFGGFLNIIKNQLTNWYNWPGLGLAAIGTVYTIPSLKKWFVFLAWPVLYFISFTLLGVTNYFWYYAPLIPGYIVLIGLGLKATYEGLRHLLNPAGIRDGWNRLLQASIVAIMLIFITAAQFNTAVRMSKRIDERNEIYRKVGEWLSNNTKADAKVGTLEVGIIGYFSKRPMVDFAGLIQPEVARQMSHASSYNDTAIYAIQYYRPQYLALRDGQLPKLEQTLASTSCTPSMQFKGSDFGSSINMTVYTCLYP